MENTNDSVWGLEGGLPIIRWLYLAREGPRLFERDYRMMTSILDKNRAPGTEASERDGLTVMSRGACMPLERTILQIDKMVSNHAGHIRDTVIK